LTGDDFATESDPFDLRQLSSVMNTMGAVTAWIQSLSRERIELEGNARKVENERNRISKEMRSLDSLHEARVARIKADCKVTEDLLMQYRSRFGDLGKADSVISTTHDRGTESRISTLESQLEYEKQERDRAIDEIRTLRKMLDDRKKDHDDMLHSEENKSLRAEVASARAELNAVSHHRSVLRETIEKLERELHQQNESIAELKHIISTEMPGRYASLTTGMNILSQVIRVNSLTNENAFF
jgi:chromosome segregation ATPase